MMNKKEITQFAKAIIHSQKGLRNQQLMHPNREWLIGVVVALGIFIASITWSALEYVKYQTIEDQTTSPSAAPAAVYRETLVAEALSAYAAKAERLNTLLGEDVSLVPEDSSEEEAQSVGDGDTELGADLEGATTTATTSSSSSTQTPAENEGPTETDTPPEDPAPNESPAPPIEEGSIQPATNI